MPAKLVWLRGTQIGVEFELSSAIVTIGRGADNAIAVGSGRASRYHAEVRRDAGGYLLVDLESANGTIVNGMPIREPYRLKAGDLFEIGDELFRYEAAEMVLTTVFPNEPLKHEVADKPVTDSMPTIRPISSAKQTQNVPAVAQRRSANPMLIIALIIVIIVVAAIGVYVVTTRAGAIPAQGMLFETLAPSSVVLKAVPVGSSPAPPASWTILVYLAGDNDLEADALRDLNEMELVGSSDQLHIIVQLDRAGRTGTGDLWATTRRYLVTRDDDTQRIGSPILQDLGELNTGDPQHLADFMVWGLKTYPAEHTALVIWDHGSAWAGTAFDSSSANDGLSLPELQQALTTAQIQLDGLRLDAIGFDACLMGQLDVLLTVAPYADSIIASAELEPSNGWDWSALFTRLRDTSITDGAGFGRAAVETYGEYYGKQGNDIAMLATFDSAQLHELTHQVGQFADAIQANMDSAYRPLAEARAYAVVYSQPRPEEFSAVDLGDLAERVLVQGAPESVASPARAVLAGITRSRSSYWSSPFHAQASGISVYLPQQQELFPAAYSQLSPLAQQTSWAQMIQAYLAAGTARVSVPQITHLQVQPGPNATGTTLTGSVAGRDIAAVYFFAGIPFADRSGVQLVQIDALRPPAGGETWGAGPYQLSTQWNADQWSLASNGVTIPVLLGPARPGTDLYGIEGLYAAQNSGQATEAALLFQVVGDQTSFLNVYVFPREQGQAAQPFEVQPVVGDSFITQIRTYTLDGSGLIVGRVTGDTMIFGTQSLQATRIPVVPGNYVTGFLVRDITGRLSYQYIDVQVGS